MIVSSNITLDQKWSFDIFFPKSICYWFCLVEIIVMEISNEKKEEFWNYFTEFEINEFNSPQ